MELYAEDQQKVRKEARLVARLAPEIGIRKLRTPMRMLFLGWLAQSPRSGYELAKMVDGSIAQAWIARHKEVYSELTRMASEGLIVPGEKEGGRGRVRYSITDTGHDTLRAWLQETDPNRHIKNEQIVRAYLLWYLKKDEALELLRREKEIHQAALAVTEGYIREWEGPSSAVPQAGLMGLELTRRLQAATVEWIDWAEKEISSGRSAARARTWLESGKTLTSSPLT